ncbi:MAG: hypothetical protein ACLQBL_36785 [Polyangiaceae bacterium]
MTSKNEPNNAAVVDACTQRLNALKQYVTSSKATVPINGVQTKVSDLIATYQNCLTTRATLNTQRAQVKATLATRTTAEAGRRAADRALKPWVINMYGADSQQAHDFGFPPPKAPVRSAEEKADAAALALATRAARHTMGAKQRKKVKGTISVPTAPAAPAITVQAAPSAASTPNQTTTTSATPVAPAAASQPTIATPQNGAASPVNGAPPQH